MQCDVLILGAGPAGSLAGLILSRAGFDVLIVEQSRFPRQKVCGECLSALGTSVLARQGLLDSVRALGAVELRRCVIHAEQSMSFQLPAPMLGISRYAMDNNLLDAAIHAGAGILQPCRVERMDKWLLRDLQSNQLSPVEFQHCLVAHGKPMTGVRNESDDFGIKAHFAEVAAPEPAIELFAVNSHYGGLAPIEHSLWNCCFSVPATRIRQFSPDFDQLLMMMMRENEALSERLATARRVGEWMAAPLPRYSALDDWPERTIPIGNAACAIEPIGGEGMGLALRSAEIAAEEIVAARDQRRGVNLDAIRNSYVQLWQARRLTCRLAANVVSHPAIADLAVRAGRHCPQLTELACRWMGKSAAL